jgi:3-deoxy-D-arabino-heptulosonate 7-phosphate (DAHP) synthase
VWPPRGSVYKPRINPFLSAHAEGVWPPRGSVYKPRINPFLSAHAEGVWPPRGSVYKPRINPFLSAHLGVEDEGMHIGAVVDGLRAIHERPALYRELARELGDPEEIVPAEP